MRCLILVTRIPARYGFFWLARLAGRLRKSLLIGACRLRGSIRCFNAPRAHMRVYSRRFRPRVGWHDWRFFRGLALLGVWAGGSPGDLRRLLDRTMRNLGFFLLGFFLVVFAGIASAAQVATGYGLDGACYSSPDKALEGFRRGLPTIREGYVTTLNSSSVAGNVLTYSITTKDFAAGTSKTLAGSLTLSSCQSVTGYMGDNMAGLLYACLMSFFTAFFLRKAFRKFSRYAGGFSTDF